MLFLFAEDDENVAAAFAELAASLGHRADIAGTGGEALRMTGQTRCGLRFNGYWVARYRRTQALRVRSLRGGLDRCVHNCGDRHSRVQHRNARGVRRLSS